MKFLKDVDGCWRNILKIRSLYISSENKIIATGEQPYGFFEMSDAYASFEEAQTELDKIMKDVNKND